MPQVFPAHDNLRKERQLPRCSDGIPDLPAIHLVLRQVFDFTSILNSIPPFSYKRGCVILSKAVIVSFWQEFIQSVKTANTVHLVVPFAKKSKQAGFKVQKRQKGNNQTCPLPAYLSHSLIPVNISDWYLKCKEQTSDFTHVSKHL